MSRCVATSMGVGAVGVYAGLFLPDLDLLLMSILHHRSIITHSILIPLLLKRWLPDAVFAGLMAGVSIHLWADSLSTTIGFAQIYLPLVKTGIGGVATFIWIILNSLAGLYFAVSVYRKYLWLIIGAYLVIALAYGVLNEGAAFIVYVLSVIGVLLFVRNRMRKGKPFSEDDSCP